MDTHHNLYLGGSPLPPPLTPKEEKELLIRLSNGDPEAKEILITRNLRLVIYISKKFENHGYLIDDLTSIGTIGLIKAINTFSINKQTKLATYASKCIQNEILMFLRNNSKHSNVISIEETVAIDVHGKELTLADILADPTTELSYEACADREQLSSLFTFALNCLPYKECIVFFYSMSNLTQREIGAIMDFSQSYVSRLQVKIHKKLRKYLSAPKEVLNKTFIFTIEEKNYCISFSRKKFTNFKRTLTQFALDNSSTYPFITQTSIEKTDSYFNIRLPMGSDTYSCIAMLIEYLTSSSLC